MPTEYSHYSVEGEPAPASSRVSDKPASKSRWLGRRGTAPRVCCQQNTLVPGVELS